MTEEEYFRKNYPDACYGDKPLSPYWDFFQDGVEFGERQSEKKIEELKQQIEKLLDFVVERTEECDVCPLSETCANSEGVCPYRNKRINLKEWILRHIEVSTVQTETKQFLEYDKMPNCLGTQTTSGN